MPMTEERLSSTFAALSDPTRRALVAKLATGDFPVNELAEPFDMSLQAISKHLKVLEKAGLVSRRRDAQLRPCHLEAEALHDATAWIESQRALWNGRVDRLEQHLKNTKRTQENKGKHT